MGFETNYSNNACNSTEGTQEIKKKRQGEIIGNLSFPGRLIAMYFFIVYKNSHPT
jgi:hypothetical protein